MESIKKDIYFYDAIQDRVRRTQAANQAFASEKESYTEIAERKGPKERAAYFLSQDIIGKSLLDFGCDDGGVLLSCKELGAKQVTGVDYNPCAIERASIAVKKGGIQNAQFFCGDIENQAFLKTLEPADTVFLLAVLGTSHFTSTQSVIATACRFSKHALYLEGHYSPKSRVRPLFELMLFTDFTKFEYLGRNDFRIMLRSSRELLPKNQIPDHAVTSDDSSDLQYGAEEIYILPHSKHFPLFSQRCRLIQYVG